MWHFIKPNYVSILAYLAVELLINDETQLYSLFSSRISGIFMSCMFS